MAVNNKTNFLSPPCCFLLGPKVLDYTYLPSLEHMCKKDILVGRIKNSEDKSWKKIRPRPTKTQYVGPYYICKGEDFPLKVYAF